MAGIADDESLSRRAARGAAWIVAARLVMRLFGFVNTIVLARLLAPADFGLVAVALTAMQLLQGFSDIGLAQAVIRFREADRRDLDTLFTLSAVRGAAIALLLWASAPFAADFFSDPRMYFVFAGVALYPLLTGVVNPKFFEFERDLDLSKEFMSSAANKFAGVAVSIAVAVVWRSYWAIILGLVASGAVQLALSYMMRPYLPRPTFASLRKVLGFSGWLTGVSVMAALNNKIDAFILARAVGAAGTGVFYVGRQLAELPTSEIASPIARAIYPGLAALHADQERMRAGFLKGVEALGVVALPAALGFAFVAADLIHLLLGAKWDAAASVVAVLTPVLGVQTLFLATQFYAMALGQTRLVFFRELIFFAARTPVFVWAAIEYGLTGAIWAVGGMGFLHIALNLALYAQVAARPFWEPAWAARRSLAAAVAMAGYFLLLRPAIEPLAAAPAALRLAADIFAGAGVYGLALLACWRIEGKPAGAERSVLDVARRAFARIKRA